MARSSPVHVVVLWRIVRIPWSEGRLRQSTLFSTDMSADFFWFRFEISESDIKLIYIIAIINRGRWSTTPPSLGHLWIPPTRASPTSLTC